MKISSDERAFLTPAFEPAFPLAKLFHLLIKHPDGLVSAAYSITFANPKPQSFSAQIWCRPYLKTVTKIFYLSTHLPCRHEMPVQEAPERRA
jgi:hypothetical protein